MFVQITASAGAGKTYTLTQLFLKHLFSASVHSVPGGCSLMSAPGEYSLSEILAATFTNKAASEMKDRVLAALKEEALLSLAAKSSGKNSAGVYEQWLLAIFRHSNILNIRTIDSLLFLLVRLSALDLGLPPDIAPSFSSDDYYTPLYDAFMSDISAYSNGIPFNDETSDPARYEEYSAAIENYYKALVTYTSHEGFAHKNRLHDDVLRIVKRSLAGEEVPIVNDKLLHTAINSLHANLLASCDHMLAVIEQEELAVHKNLLSAIDKARQSSAYDKISNSKITQPGLKELAEVVTKKSKNIPSAEAQAVYEKLCRDYDLFSSKIPVLLSALPLVPLIPLAGELVKRIRANIAFSLLLPAELIPQLASRVLSGEHGVSDALCRMGNSLHHILLDEFQDTSVEQWKAIEPMVIECLSKGGSFTYVGDVKQAIYSWRKGEIRLFDGILSTALSLGREPQLKTLDKNWRSSPCIIDFNNAFFSLLNQPAVVRTLLESMLPAETPEAVTAETQKRLCSIYENVKQNLPPADIRPEYRCPGQVFLYKISAKSSELLDETIKTRLLRLIPELRKRWQYEDITILTRSGNESASVATWLTNAGIPVITENSFLLADNPIVSRLMALLAFVDYPYDDLALWEFLTGEECFGAVSGLSRQQLDIWLAGKRSSPNFAHTPVFQLFRADYPMLWERWIAPFHNKAGLMTAYDMLHESMRVFQLFTLKPADAPFLIRLLELAHYAETQGISSLAGFLQFWEKAKDQEKIPSPPHMPAVSIMTMHKAKGLEFPVVILPFQHGGGGLDNSLVVDDSLGIRLLTRISKNTPQSYYEKEATNAIECINLLYVAWTRPQYELHSFITSHGRPAMLARGLNVLLEEFIDSGYHGYVFEEILPDAENTDETENREDENADEPGLLRANEPSTVLPARPPFAVEQLSLRHQTSREHNEPEGLKAPLTAFQGGHPSDTAHLPRERYLMNWLPELKIFRTNLENLTFTPTQRGDLFHLCLEHLALPAEYPADNAALIEESVNNAIVLGMQKFPFAIPHNEQLMTDISKALRWFASQPCAGNWLAHGLREQSLLGADNSLYRVDLLVPEKDGLRAIDYKTGGLAGHAANLQQVKNYMRLLSQARNTPVYGTLVYLDLQQITEVE